MKQITTTESWTYKTPDGLTDGTSAESTTEYFDDNDRKVKAVRLTVENGVRDRGVTLFEYDGKGRLIRKYGDGAETVHSYVDDGKGPVTETVRWRCDGDLHERVDVLTRDGRLLRSTEMVYRKDGKVEPLYENYFVWGDDGKKVRDSYRHFTDGKVELYEIDYSYSLDGNRETCVETCRDDDGSVSTSVTTTVRDAKGRVSERRCVTDGETSGLSLYTYSPDDDNRTEYHEIYGCEPGRTPGWRLSAVLEMTVRVERD